MQESPSAANAIKSRFRPRKAHSPTARLEGDRSDPAPQSEPPLAAPTLGFAKMRSTLARLRDLGGAALAQRAQAVFTLGGGVVTALAVRAGIRAQAAPGDVHARRVANAKAAEKLGDALRKYHHYRVEHFDRIPAQGAVLVVAHHSLATYDIGLLAGAIRRSQGRMVHTLVDRLIFKITPLGNFLASIGCVEAAPHTAAQLLGEGNVVIVAPGGMREALRPSTKRYSLSWENRYGFARLAIDTQTPVVCAACPGADDLYDVYPSDLTNYFLKRFHLPVPLLRGIGLTLLPRAQTLVHHISEPLQPPAPAKGEAFTAQVHAFQQLVAARMETLLR